MDFFKKKLHTNAARISRHLRPSSLRRRHGKNRGYDGVGGLAITFCILGNMWKKQVAFWNFDCDRRRPWKSRHGKKLKCCCCSDFFFIPRGVLEINGLDKIARRSKRVGGAIADLWGSHYVCPSKKSNLDKIQFKFSVARWPWKTKKEETLKYPAAGLSTMVSQTTLKAECMGVQLYLLCGGF